LSPSTPLDRHLVSHRKTISGNSIATEHGEAGFLLDRSRLTMDRAGAKEPSVTFPTKVPSLNLGRIRRTGKIERKLLDLLALGDPDRRFIH
jgi:hypothetical protein